MILGLWKDKELRSRRKRYSIVTMPYIKIFFHANSEYVEDWERDNELEDGE